MPRPQDPDHTILHRALRIAIVLPVLLWVGLHVLHDAQFALVAAFGVLCLLAAWVVRSRAGARAVARLQARIDRRINSEKTR